jgi:hypothetical protein
MVYPSVMLDAAVVLPCMHSVLVLGHSLMQLTSTRPEVTNVLAACHTVLSERSFAVVMPAMSKAGHQRDCGTTPITHV